MAKKLRAMHKFIEDIKKGGGSLRPFIAILYPPASGLTFSRSRIGGIRNESRAPGLFQKNHLLHAHVISSVQAVEVKSACDAGSVELYRLYSGIKMLSGQ